MKILFFIISLVLSLPNLLLGFALVVLQRTFATRNPLQIMIDLLDSVAWGVPAAAGVLLILLVAGCFTVTRPYAAISGILLNLAALFLVVTGLHTPEDLWEAVLFVPLLVALAGFAWITWYDFTSSPAAPTRCRTNLLDGESRAGGAFH